MQKKQVFFRLRRGNSNISAKTVTINNAKTTFSVHIGLPKSFRGISNNDSPDPFLWEGADVHLVVLWRDHLE